jgi:FtsZ-interacting cell division protein YlmF
LTRRFLFSLRSGDEKDDFSKKERKEKRTKEAKKEKRQQKKPGENQTKSKCRQRMKGWKMPPVLEIHRLSTAATIHPESGQDILKDGRMMS